MPTRQADKSKGKREDRKKNVYVNTCEVVMSEGVRDVTPDAVSVLRCHRRPVSWGPCAVSGAFCISPTGTSHPGKPGTRAKWQVGPSVSEDIIQYFTNL